MKCHECGADMVRDVRPGKIVCEGRTVTIDQPGWYCLGCNTVVLSAKDSLVMDEAFVQLRGK